MFDIEKSFEAKHYLRVTFRDATSTERMRSIIEDSGGHLFHLFFEGGYTIAFVVFPLAQSLGEKSQLINNYIEVAWAY